MMSVRFNGRSLTEFGELLKLAGEKEVGRAMWTATGRSLGFLRREFLDESRVHLGKNPKESKGAQKSHNPKTRGIAFRWIRTPKKRSEVKHSKQVKGALFTHSTAALGLEKGSPVRPKRGKYLVIPILIPGQPNTANRKQGKSSIRVKPNWATFRKFKEKNGNRYEYELKDRGTHKVVYARRRYKLLKSGNKSKRGREASWFPIFTMMPRVRMPKRLGYFKSYRNNKSGVVRRFREELDKAIARIVKRRLSRHSGRR
jgi:hypothetical protein